MLTAYSPSRQLLVAPEGREAELRTMGRDKALMCPACEGNVYFRSGSFTPHFVHYSSECTVRFSEPESRSHLAAKWAVYKALKRQGLPAELEHYVPETRQRADVWTINDGKPVALEVQMSPITAGVWRERRELYQSVGIKDYWYLGWEPKPRGHDFIHNSFVLRGTGYWDSPVRGLEHNFLAFDASVSIFEHLGGELEWRVGLGYTYSYDYSWRGSAGVGGVLSISIPMDNFRFFRGCPDTEDGLLARLTRQLVRDYPKRPPLYGLPDDWIKRYFTFNPANPALGKIT